MLEGHAVDPAPPPTPRSVGQAIRELRHELGLSQEELAYRSGLDRSYVGGVERAERNPSLRILIQLAEGMRLPLSAIMARAETLARNKREASPDR
jgi:transcriptional regulator with XRE-family HTH domain